MEEQVNLQGKLTLTGGESEIIQLVANTFNARSPMQVRQAELRLVQSFAVPGFIEKLLVLLNPQKNLEANLMKAIANLIKSYSYDYPKNSGDKEEFINKLFSLIVDDRIDSSVRQLLGTGLQYQFNSDEDGIYKNTIIDRAFVLLNGEEVVKKFEGVLIVALAYLNSLLQMENQVDFFIRFIDPLCIASARYYDFLTKLSNEEWVRSQKKYILIVSDLINFLETAIQRIVDEEQDFRVELQNLRTNTLFVQLLEHYALLFHNNHSIISIQCPSVNPTKSSILNVVKLLYIGHQCPLKLFQIIFITFLFECKGIVKDHKKEQILVRCLQILEDHLKRKIYYQIYLDYKIQTIFALFMYSATTPQQLQYIQTQPEKFVEIAQEYSESYGKSHHLKVKASCFLQVYIEKMDEAIRNVSEILIIILTGGLDINSQDSVVMSAAKTEFSRFDFFGLSNQQRLEAALLILTSITSHIKRRQDIGKVIYSFFITQYQSLIKIESPLIVLRLIRALSYYPSSLYFMHIRSQMVRGRAFVLEGFKSFERILKFYPYADLLSILTEIFIDLLSIINVNDSIFELLILNNYSRLLRNNDHLYGLSLCRIKQEFMRNLAKNQHNTLLCFNLIIGILRKEDAQIYLVRIQTIYYQMLKILNKVEFRVQAQTYSQKIIQINMIIISKHIQLRPQIEEWGLTTLRQIDQHYKGSIIFKFYNRFFMKLNGSWGKVEPYYKAFLEEVRRRLYLTGDNEEHLEVIPFYFYLLGQIASNFDNVILEFQDIMGLLLYTSKLPETFKQFPLSFLLCCLYKNPAFLLKILKENNIYESTLRIIVGTKFEGKIFRKIFLLAFIKVLHIEDNMIYFKQMMEHCVNYLKVQFKRGYKESRRVTRYEVRPRLHEEEGTLVKEEAMEAQQEDDNELVNLFVNFKHPFQNLSEFDQFKGIFLHNERNFNGIGDQMRDDIRQLLKIEWVSNRTRVINHVRVQP